MWFGLSLCGLSSCDLVKFMTCSIFKHGSFQKNLDRVLEASPFQRKWRGSGSVRERRHDGGIILPVNVRGDLFCSFVYLLVLFFLLVIWGVFGRVV